MEPRWPKWRFQHWKSPPIFDSVILPRKLEEGQIRYIKIFKLTFLLILSNDSSVEIWNITSGIIVYSHSFVDKINYVDFVDFYKHHSNNESKNLEDWTLLLANLNGFLIVKDFEATEVRQFSDPQIQAITNCFYKCINEIATIVIVSNDLNIVSCRNLELILTISRPFPAKIDYVLVTTDLIVVGSNEHLSVFLISEINETQIKYKHHKDITDHKNRILNLIDVDENYLATISSDAVRIWRKPDCNITCVFNTGFESMFHVDKSVLYSINSKYLTVVFNCGFFIFDCSRGSTLTKVIDAHDTKIIGIAYLNWLSMLLTISKDGVARFWAFQLTDYGLDSKRIQSPSPDAKSNTFFNCYVFNKNLEDRTFLGKSVEKFDKECQQVSCFFECKYSVKSKYNFVNLEEIGILTNDGSSNIILWRNRDYAFNRLIKIIQN